MRAFIAAFFVTLLLCAPLVFGTTRHTAHAQPKVEYRIPPAVIKYSAKSQATMVFGGAGVALQRPVQVNYVSHRNGYYLIQLTIVPRGQLGMLFEEKLNDKTLRITSLSPYNAS